MSHISDKKIRQLIYEKYDGRCAYCGCELTSENYQIDHIEPKNRHLRDPILKGEDAIYNYNPSCASCNTTKHNMCIEEFRDHLSDKTWRLNKDSSLYRTVKRYGLIRETGNNVIFHFEKINHGEKND